MKKEEIGIRYPYIAPELQCVEILNESPVLTASGDINDIPWED